MRGKSKQTTDHETIRHWAEQRGGKPAVVKGTEDGEGGGVLRINFPGGTEEALQDISWDDFFKTFDERNLVFVYQDNTADGRENRFNKFVNATAVKTARENAAYA